MEIVVKYKERELVIPMREPTFEELSAALMALRRSSAGIDLAGAGALLLATCADHAKMPKEVNEIASVKLSAALAAAELLEFHESELKKN